MWDGREMHTNLGRENRGKNTPWKEIMRDIKKYLIETGQYDAN
jgi:hypothetical protein